MPFEKGNTHGKNSSRKGVENRNTKAVREFYKQIIEDRYDQLNEDLDKLTPKQRWEVILKLSSFLLPKLKEVDIKDSTTPDHIRELLNMSEDTIKKVYGV